MVIGEHAPQLTLAELERLVLAQSPQRIDDFQLLSQRQWHQGADGGTLLKTSGTVQGMPFTYLYRLMVAGDTAYQVLAFTHSARFDAVEQELVQVMNTFQPRQEHAAR